jgi:NADPH:quinone reductase-like Zn-dependent oxidoreductase
MAEHQALILPAKFGKWEVGPVPTPTPGPDELLVKVLASGEYYRVLQICDV